MAAIRAFSKALIPAAAVVAAATPSAPVSPEKQPIKPKLIKPSELPLYKEEECCCHHHEHPKKKSSLEKGIGELRIVAKNAISSLDDSTKWAKEAVQTGRKYTKDTIDYLYVPEHYAERIGAYIAAFGLGYLLPRGGFFKKTLFGGGVAAAVATIISPNEAALVYKRAYIIGKYYALVGYTKIRDELASNDKKPTQKHKEKEQVTVEKIADQQKSESKSSPTVPASPGKIKGDFGQSNPEDRDMYTTRG